MERLKHKTFASGLVGVLVAATGALLLGMLTACSGGTNSGEDMRAQQAKDAKALEDLFSGVQGRWEGVVSNPSIGLEPFRAEMILYTYYVQDGANPDGSIRLRPALRGKFRPLDFVTETDLMTLTGYYDRSGSLIMTGQAMSPTGAATGSGAGSSGAAAADTLILSIRGTAAGGHVNLEVTRQGGVWGYFDASRVSTDASAPLAGEATEYRERFLRINGPIEGRYFGTLKAIEGNDYKVEIDLVIIEQPLASGGSRPVLLAQYKRLDAPPGTLEWSLSVDYNSQTGDVIMRESALTGGSSVPGGMILSVSGKMKTVSGKKVLAVDVRNKTARLGSLEAVRRDGSGRTALSLNALKAKIENTLILHMK